MYIDTYLHIKFYMQVKNVFFIFGEKVSISLVSLIDKLM